MGAESSVLENCTWDDEVKTSVDSDWCLRQATLRDDTSVSVFQHKKSDRKETNLLYRGTKNLRTLRHPALLRFIASGDNSSGLYLVTEQVRPLENCLSSLHPLEICAGLHSLLDALRFLHDTVGVTHNNICLSSIFVANDGSWKLGGLEHSCKFTEATPEYLDKCLAFRDEDAISPEEKQGNVSASEEHGHARDVFAFGVLAEQLLEKLQELGDLTKTFELRVQDECLNVDPAQRPHVQSLLNDRLFRHDFLNVLEFLKTLTTKTEEEKKDFFKTVSAKLLGLPEELVAKCLSVPLLSRFVMLDETANSHMLPNLLTPYKGEIRPKMTSTGQPTPILSADLFKTHIIPELFRIFHIRDVHIRLVLLTHFASYVDLFAKETLEDVIFPQLLIGLRDTDDRIVAASLRSLSCLVPILGGDLIIGGQRKKFFTEGMPKFNLPCREDEKNRKSKNVSGIMGKKMLLKDLAALSKNGSVVTNDASDAKKKERERRREEAQQRREERKKKLKEQQKNETNKNSLSEGLNHESDNVDEMIYRDDSVKPEEVNREENGTERDDWSDWDNENNPTKSAENSPGRFIGNSNCDIAKDVDNQSDTASQSVSDESFDEDQFSDEIEKELRSMPSTVQPVKSPVSVEPAPIVDWSDTSSSPKRSIIPQSSMSGALKLGQTKSKSSEKSSRESAAKPEVEWGETWDVTDTHDSFSHSEKSTSAKTTQKLSSQKKVNIPKPNDDLGSEFDIKVKKMAVTSNEMDFFSDMVPEIKTSHKDPLSELTQDTGSGQRADLSSKKKEVTSMTFAVMEVGGTEDGEAGWGDDLDWGTEDF